MREYHGDLKSIELINIDDVTYKEANQVNKNAYSIRIKKNIDTSSILVEEYFTINTPFLNNAYALSIAPPRLIMKDSVIAINVISLKKFDEAHLAESDITLYFGVGALKQSLIENNIINYFNYNTIPLNLEVFDMKLITPPSEKGMHQFKVVITLKNGKKMEAITKEVELQ